MKWNGDITFDLLQQYFASYPPQKRATVAARGDVRAGNLVLDVGASVVARITASTGAASSQTFRSKTSQSIGG